MIGITSRGEGLWFEQDPVATMECKSHGRTKYWCGFDNEMALCSFLESNGLERAAEPSDHFIVMALPASIGDWEKLRWLRHKAGAWVWGSSLLPLACKARLFSALGAAGPWPTTWVVRSEREIQSWRPAERDFYVKHPLRGGGTGTRRARSIECARAVAMQWLREGAEAAVVQVAVEPATLPKGPSIFELRVWSLLRHDSCWTCSEHRAKTATVGCNLMNKRVQMSKPDYGKFYDRNVANEATVRDAFPAGMYDAVARPRILDAINRVHKIVKEAIEPGVFYFIGFDFVLDQNARPYLLEANVKPPSRYANLEDQFPSLLVRRLARAALTDLARLVAAGSEPNHDKINPECRWQRYDLQLPYR